MQISFSVICEGWSRCAGRPGERAQEGRGREREGEDPGVLCVLRWLPAF